MMGTTYRVDLVPGEAANIAALGERTGVGPQLVYEGPHLLGSLHCHLLILLFLIYVCKEIRCREIGINMLRLYVNACIILFNL